MARTAEWLATILSIIGTFLVGSLYIEGLFCWLVANPLWYYVGKHKRMPGLMWQSAIFTGISIYSIWFWLTHGQMR